MLPLRNCFAAFLLGIAGMIPGLGCQTAPKPPPEVSAPKVLKVKGEATFSMDRENWEKLTAGRPLQPGITIKTAASSVDLRLNPAYIENPPEFFPIIWFDDRVPALSYWMEQNVQRWKYEPHLDHNNLLRIFDNSTLFVEQLPTTLPNATNTDSNTRVRLLAGVVMIRGWKLEENLNLEVLSPLVTVGLTSGSIPALFVVDSTNLLTVIEGSVAATTKEGAAPIRQEVKAGEKFNYIAHTIETFEISVINVTDSDGHP